MRGGAIVAASRKSGNLKSPPDSNHPTLAPSITLVFGKGKIMEIIPARESHILPIVDMWKVFMDYHSAIDPFLARSLNGHIHFESFLREMMNSPEALVLAALSRENVLGYAISRLNKYTPVFLNETYGYICDMAVRDSYRRKGIGERMLQRILEWFDSRGVSRIELRVVAANRIGCSFWKKMGFESFSHTLCMTRSVSPQKDLKPPSPLKDSVLNPDCAFCRKCDRGDVLFKNELAFALWDEYPVARGHTLILPRRHVEDFFDLTSMERIAMEEIINFHRKKLLEEDMTIQGFNVGVNIGKAAGQTIFHSHIHLIPRREGDTPDPAGGVRGVIPDKMHYKGELKK